MSIESKDPRSVPDLIGDVVREANELLRTEGKLIRAEISDKFTQVQLGGGSLAAGAICLIVALVILAQALVIALAHLVGPGWAALVVAVVFGLAGMVLINRGKTALATVSLVPDRAIEQLQKDRNLVKEQVR